MKIRICLYITILTLGAVATGFAQDYSKKLEEAAKYHKEYNFNKAIEIYCSILAARPDSTLKNEADSAFNMNVQALLVKSQNGKSLLHYSYIPTPVTSKSFPLSTFFLNLPGFENGSWIKPPKQYTKEGEDNIWSIMNLPAESKVMVFSAKDESGAWNIMYSTRLNDSLWSAPQIANENITTAGDEILPHLSPCGKKLYFASNGHTGMGGFDLYVSEWNEETGDWDIAQNLGFPFSSTANDYIYYNSTCGNFTIFASDRYTKDNQVTAYVIQREAFPLKSEISQGDAPKYARMEYSLPDKSSNVSQSPKTGEEETENPLYTKTANRAHELEKKIQESITALDNKRTTYSNTSDSLKRVAMEPDMLLLEKEIISLNAQLAEVMNQLQTIELELLAKGITIKYQPNNNSSAQAEQQKETVPHFAFVQNSIGKTPDFTFEIIEPALDLSFKIGKEAFIANLSELPKGLIYHIQLMTTTRKASLKALKGFSPVFERKLLSGKYTYSVGAFHKYADALKNLNTVRKNGFPTALITAYNNGKSISTKNARELEKQDNSIYRVIIGGYDILPAEALAAIRDNTTRDIAKANINGVMKYVIGPFQDRQQAEKLMNALLAKQVTNVEIEKLENK